MTTANNGDAQFPATGAEHAPDDAPGDGPEGRSLLFLSCDIVGSTRFKQSMALWQKTFLTFYREFPQVLGDLAADAKFECEFILWKPVGDELIFTVHVRKEEEIYHAVRLWLQAMDKYEKDSLEGTPLATKGGAFIATFPGPDSESSIPRNPTIETSDKGVFELNADALKTRSADYMYDYFGPSIDTGFRVFNACENRYFTLSVEVAWALAQCAMDAGIGGDEKYPLKHLRLLDTRVFKGVWDGRPYPLFALDRHLGDPINRAIAAIQDTELTATQVVYLCQECSKEPTWPSKLYLPDSEHGVFCIKPVDSLEELASNSMEGAETLPPETSNGDGDELEADPPLPEPKKTLNIAGTMAAVQAAQAAVNQLRP